MSQLIKYTLEKSSAINRCLIQCLASRQIHIASSLNARSEYDKIKLRQFKDAPYDGSTEKWRRRKRYPHHVENVKWREEQGLPYFLNSIGPLTDLPDYSYVEDNINKPSTLSKGQKTRLLEQQDYAKKIIEYIKEIDHGKERYQRILKEKENEIQKIVSSKLNPKGNETL